MMKRKQKSCLILILIFLIFFPLKIIASELDQTLESFLRKNELPEAQEFLDQYLRSNPESREARFYLGKIHSDGDSSLRYFSEVIDLTDTGGKSAEALLWMCKYSFLRGSYSITLEQTKEFEKRFHHSLFLPQILWLSGSSYRVTGYTHEAQQQFRKISEEFPRSQWAPWALLGTGDCFFSGGEFAQAINHYRRLIDRYPDSDPLPLALISLCWSLIETKEIENALLYYNLYQDRFSSGISDREELLERIRAELSEKIKKEKKAKRKTAKYTIQVGLFSNKDQAEKEFKRFESRGYTTTISKVSKDQEVLWRVEVGIFDSKKRAENLKSRLERQFGKTYKVIDR